MATADEIRGQIEAARQRLQVDTDAAAQAVRDVAAARERQQLRRELDALNEQIETQQSAARSSNLTRHWIDQDMVGQTGTFTASRARDFKGAYPESVDKKALRHNLADCGSSVSEGELEWAINGMSWLMDAMSRAGTSVVKGPELSVGGARFILIYNPHRGVVNTKPSTECGSLVLRHLDKGDMIMRHSFYIKRGDGEFVQWGETAAECYTSSDTHGWVFGPDVTVEGNENEDGDVHSDGIFCLDHDALTASEWVHDDALTVKVEIELLSNTPKRRAITVPPPSLGADLLAQLADDACGGGGDVTFVVEGERIGAHAVVLCARSEVFARELSGSMREATTREAVIEECDVVTFRALLRFLYSDDLGRVDEWIQQMVSQAAAEGGAAAAGDDDGASAARAPSQPPQANRIALLQRVLAASHRYETRSTMESDG